ncbi:GNAT family protein [Brevibacillus migulae]|uniref:hypothetical protein n=1 Tax=Brevibacillus migulae TaxID=1644114 RepID=UPI001431F0AF|nr:hypothetical protein [Brevibacillus migulae]
MIFREDRLTVRLLTEDDKPLLVQWLSKPTVLAYYEGRDNLHDTETSIKTFIWMKTRK